MAKADDRFVNAVYAMEKRAKRANLAAYLIINPDNAYSPLRVQIAYGARTSVVAWLPGPEGERALPHCGSARGYGYDKASAAMTGARYVKRDGTEAVITDNGEGWDHQLNEAGYLVVRAI